MSLDYEAAARETAYLAKKRMEESDSRRGINELLRELGSHIIALENRIAELEKHELGNR